MFLSGNNTVKQDLLRNRVVDDDVRLVVIDLYSAILELVEVLMCLIRGVSNVLA